MLVNNSYTNKKAHGSLSKTRKRQISHILETSPTHASEYNEKWVFTENINTNNTFYVRKKFKTDTNIFLV